MARVVLHNLSHNTYFFISVNKKITVDKRIETHKLTHMKKKLIALVVAAVLLATNVQAIVLGWSFDRSTGLFTFKVPVTAGKNYSIARYDIKNNYYDVYTNWTATVTGTNTVVVNPMLPSDEDQPTPSGQCYFYVVEL